MHETHVWPMIKNREIFFCSLWRHGSLRGGTNLILSFLRVLIAGKCTGGSERTPIKILLFQIQGSLLTGWPGLGLGPRKLLTAVTGPITSEPNEGGLSIGEKAVAGTEKMWGLTKKVLPGLCPAQRKEAKRHHGIKGQATCETPWVGGSDWSLLSHLPQTHVATECQTYPAHTER